MTREDIIRMAREAGMEFRENADEFNTAYCDGVHRDELEHFAALAFAAEREACAKVCEGMTLEWEDQPSIAQAELATIMDCALAIRARGQE